MKHLIKTLDFLLFSNIFIALCAVAQGLLTYRLVHAKPQNEVLAILFCSTLAFYNVSILLSKPKKPKKSSYKRVKWIFSHQRLVVTLTLVVLVSLIPLVLFLSMPSLIVLLMLGVISASYNVPVIRFNNQWVQLRSIPGLKLFLIAIVWSLSCVLLPILELNTSTSGANVSFFEIAILLIMEFFFIAAITIPFDIRDFFQDKYYHLQTLPTMLGIQKAKWISFAFLGLYAFLLCFYNASTHFAVMLFCVFVTGWVVALSSMKKSEYFYFLLLDGMMLAPVLVMFIIDRFIVCL